MPRGCVGGWGQFSGGVFSCPDAGVLPAAVTHGACESPLLCCRHVQSRKQRAASPGLRHSTGGVHVDAFSPSLTDLQRETAMATDMSQQRAPKTCVVTGGTGFVGQRLVEMLVERGATRVISYDIVPRPADAWQHPAIEWVVGDICDVEHLCRVVDGADCVWHNAAAVGPFHPKALYYKVNYQGTLNVIEACKRMGVRKIVMSSSPSTRFNWKDIDGATEDDMPKLPQKRYMQPYAETKAMGEVAMLAANSPELMTIAVAPHQVGLSRRGLRRGARQG